MINKHCKICGCESKVFGLHQEYQDFDDYFDPILRTWLIIKCKMGHKYRLEHNPNKNMIEELNK